MSLSLSFLIEYLIDFMRLLQYNVSQTLNKLLGVNKQSIVAHFHFSGLGAVFTLLEANELSILD